jgi:hypothetical protein
MFFLNTVKKTKINYFFFNIIIVKIIQNAIKRTFAVHVQTIYKTILI